MPEDLKNKITDPGGEDGDGTGTAEETDYKIPGPVAGLTEKVTPGKTLPVQPKQDS